METDPVERTGVAIIGAGPAGLFLAHLLHAEGVASVVLESRSRDHVERRVRAGVLEHGAAELLREAGVGARLDREGLPHDGVNLQFEGERHRIDFRELTGRGIIVYGQQEVVKDLIVARLEAGQPLLFEAEALAVDVADRDRPKVRYRAGGMEAELACDFVAACDGSYGIGRGLIPAGTGGIVEHEYEHAWLGVLARTPPPSPELVYAYHQNGFALQSMRSPALSRLYLQVGRDEDLAAWPESRLWNELRLRLGEPSLQAGEVLEIGVTPMRSLVIEPMQSGRVFLCGDAAHIVPPTGAKGMNLALGDVAILGRALAAWYATRSDHALESYSSDCSRRVWRAQNFSNFMTRLLHTAPADDAFDHRLRLAELRRVTTSRAAATALAEDYTGAATDVTR